MSVYILDTDHISLYQNNHIDITHSINAMPAEKMAVTIISFEEQVRGRLAIIRRAKMAPQLVHAYRLLEQTLDYFAGATVLPFTEAAAIEFMQLRQQKIRVGSNDLKIAAIALSMNSIVVTRNRRDFERVPGLTIEDWSV